MTSVLRCLGVIALCGARLGAQDAPAHEHAFVEIAAAQDRYYVHERIELQLLVAVEERFAATQLIQPFRRELDVAVRVEAAWLDELAGAVAVDAEAAVSDTESRLSLVINDRRADAIRGEDRVVGGRRFTVLEISRTYRCDRPGRLAIPAPTLRYVYATRFREDFVSGRVAQDPREASVFGNTFALRIVPLPVAGRPPTFTGAVGRFSIEAATATRRLLVGESFKLVLRIGGRGNLEFFEPPRLAALKRFHVYGQIEDRNANGRTITYDLVPLTDEVAALPGIAFSFFDPARPGRYHTLHTEPISIDVRPGSAGSRLLALPDGEVTPAVAGHNDIFDLKSAAPGSSLGARSLPAALLVGAVLAPWVLAFGFLFRRRTHARRRRDSERSRARDEAAAFRSRSRAAATDRDLADAFSAYLAARLRCSIAEVIAPELPQRLVDAGVPEGLADRTATRLDDLVAVRYGGAAVDGSPLGELVDALEIAFEDREPPP